MNARLQLAYVGMHPARRADLVDRMGSADAVLASIRKGTVEVPDHARLAAGVPAAIRLEQLREDGLAVALREEMPDHLSELPDCPDLLFVRGSLPSVPGVAVVGSRRATAYGMRMANAYGRALAKAGWPVVSGLARGVDGSAHRGVVEADGCGIAVLGSGPDIWYPKEHRAIGEQLVAAGGAVVTEYPPGTPPNGWRFPPRNRIISGFSLVVVVVEAARTGGALITARTALSQGREVFAVPGDIDRPTSEGCNLLIRDGAVPVFDSDDLIEAASIVLGPPKQRPMGNDGDEILRLIGPIGRSIDALAEDLSKPAASVLADVARLEAHGLVRRSGGLISRDR